MSGSGRKKAKRRIVYRGTPQNRVSMILAMAVVLSILIAIGVRGVYLKGKLAEYDARIEELQDEIASETERSEEIEEYAKYVQTDEYVEEVARDKLGLVREGEIIFRNDADADSGTSEGTDVTGETQEETDSAESGESVESESDAEEESDTEEEEDGSDG